MQGWLRAWSVGGLGALMAMAGCVLEPDRDDDDEADAAPPGSLHNQVVTNARLVSKDIDTPQEALAAGYVADPFCVPGMGVHWIRASALDTRLDPDVPEVVLFLPVLPDVGGQGVPGIQDDPLFSIGGRSYAMTFLGVEHVVVVEGTENNATDAGPYLFGVPLDGPMAGHTPEMPWHKELHIYLADGIESGPDFAGGNDAIECPPGTTPA